MSVTWKCFDGIQREDISISDVRDAFGFQTEVVFNYGLIVKRLFIIELVNKQCQVQ